MNARGHNERSFRLDALAAEAREGLAKVEQGEEFTIGGWLVYGHALNEGRALFLGDKEFGEWVALCQLDTADRHDRAAAMWAAANADQFEEARQRGNPRTIRGIHAKWKEIEAERAEEQRRLEAEAKFEADQEQVTAPEANENRAEDNESPEAVTIGSKADQETPSLPADDVAPDAVAEGTSGGGGHSPAPAPEPDPEDAATAKLRAEARSLTREALEEDWISLRQGAEEYRSRIGQLRSEVSDLSAQIKVLTDVDDSGRKIGALMRQLDQAKGRSAEYQANAARLQKQVNAQAAEIKNLRRELEKQEVPL